MIVFDTETTGLLKPLISPLDQQPFICEICAVRVDDKSFKVIGAYETLVRPPIKMPEASLKIHGLTDERLAGAPTFARQLPKFSEFLLGERSILAHNVAFDIQCLEMELRRLGKVTSFPWPPEQICSVERTNNIRGHRLTLSKLHEIATGKPHEDGAHRARADVDALIRCLPYLKKEKLL